MGRYLEQVNDGEEVVLSRRPHVIHVLPSVSVVVVTIAGLIVWSRLNLEGSTNSTARTVALVAFALSAAWAGWAWLEWRYTRFHLTNFRVLMWSGVLARRRSEIPLDRVNTVFVEQRIIDRILRCGDLSIESAGEGGRETFPRCPRPLDVKQAIHRQKHSDRLGASGDAGRTSSDADADLASQLERLATLRDRGELDEWEFSDAKARLLRSSTDS